MIHVALVVAGFYNPPGLKLFLQLRYFIIDGYPQLMYFTQCNHFNLLTHHIYLKSLFSSTWYSLTDPQVPKTPPEKKAAATPRPTTKNDATRRMVSDRISSYWRWSELLNLKLATRRVGWGRRACHCFLVLVEGMICTDIHVLYIILVYVVSLASFSLSLSL